MRAIWSGAISFGLVNIPIKLYSAAESNPLSFDMLDKHDHSQIKYKRVNSNTGREVPYEDIVKGYKIDDEYVVLTDADFKKVNIEKTKTLDIVDFVNEDEIDSVYYEKPYYLEPDKNASKSYNLLMEALKKSKKVGVAIFVIRNREHLGVIKPHQNMLILNQIRFQHEIRKPEDLTIPKGKELRGKELEMALALIDQLSGKFEPKSYKDTYTDEIMKMIEMKAKGKTVRAKGKEPKATKPSDLMTLLKASLKQKKKRAA